jgi:hypothetical protein
MFLGSKVRLVRRADNLTVIYGRLSRQCGIFNISQPYRPPRPVTGIALLYFTYIQLGPFHTSKGDCISVRCSVLLSGSPLSCFLFFIYRKFYPSCGLWHTYPLSDNDRGISKYTAAVMSNGFANRGVCKGAREEWCFMCGPCRSVVSKRVMECVTSGWPQLFVVTSCKRSVNPIINPNPVYSNSSRDSVVLVWECCGGFRGLIWSSFPVTLLMVPSLNLLWCFISYSQHGAQTQYFTH